MLRRRKLVRDNSREIKSLKKEFDYLFRTWLSQARSEADYDGNGEDEKGYIFHIESRAITNFYNELEKYRDYIFQNYRGQLWIRGKWYPRKWMLNDDKISNLLSRYRIADVLNELEKNLFTPEKAQCETKNSKGRRSLYPYACFVTNPDFYEKIVPELGMSKITLQKYLTAFRKVGALRKLPKTGQYEEKNEILYAVGYYSDYNRRPKLNRFLTAQRKSDLRNFKI